MASHGERLLCMNCLEVVNGNLINGDQAALGRKGREKQPLPGKGGKLTR